MKMMIQGLAFVLSMFLTAQPVAANSNVYSLSCSKVTCNVNYVPNTETASSITIMGTGLTAWVHYNIVIGISHGTIAMANLAATIQYDGTLYSVIDLNTLQPGYYNFMIYPATARNTIIGSGNFTVVGARTGPPPAPAGSLVGTWISMGMAVPTPLVINANGTYRFGNNVGNYRTTATGGIFSGFFAGMNGGQGVLGNGTLQFRPPGPGAVNWWYTFRRQ